jgi:hypothetical protein
LKRVVQVDFAHARKALLGIAGKVNSLELGRQLFETVVGNGCEQALPVGKMAIDGHGRDVAGSSDAPHGNRLASFFVEQAAGGGGDSFRSGAVVHVYSVYILNRTKAIAQKEIFHFREDNLRRWAAHLHF